VLVVAHFGHWLVGVLQFIPVLIFIGWLVFSQMKDKRREKAEAKEAAAKGGEPAPDA